MHLDKTTAETRGEEDGRPAVGAGGDELEMARGVKALVEGHGAVEYTLDDPRPKESPLGSQTPQNRGLRQQAKMAATRKSSLFFGFVCSLIWLASCGPCSDTPRSRVVSADGRLVANVYERNCGATTDLSSMVNVQNASDKFNGDEGRLFVAKGRYDISVIWTGPRALLIKCTGCSRNNIFREVTVDGDIDVSYSLASDSRN